MAGARGAGPRAVRSGGCLCQSRRRRLALELLKQRPLDADPHLPIALGAALEVQSQVLVARGQRTQAVALLQSALRTYGNTSIHDRLQKNLNLLSFQGKVAPALKSDQFLGAKLPLPAQLKGSPVLLFFWAHWCGDCKAEAPIITQLRSEFAGKGLQVIGPTRLYGYTAQIEHASPSDELQYIDAVRHRFYSGLLDMPVPISKSNFDTYGASTTPTLVLLDRAGKVAWYHPGAVPYGELRAEIEKSWCGKSQAGYLTKRFEWPISKIRLNTRMRAPIDYRPITKAVGWLSRDHEFEILEPTDELLDLIWQDCKFSVARCGESAHAVLPIGSCGRSGFAFFSRRVAPRRLPATNRENMARGWYSARLK